MIRVDVLETLKDLHPHVNIFAIFFVKGISFLHSISRGYDFRTIEIIKDFGRKYSKVHMLKGMKKCINMYHTRGL